MTTLVVIGDVVAFGAGGALIWFFKDKIQALVIGGNALAAKLDAKAKALRAVL